jgi:hypothetical protein
MIYLLERLRCETNISFVLRDGVVDKIRAEIKSDHRALVGAELSDEEVDEVLASKGEKVCDKYGIEVCREWQTEWRMKMLEKDGRALSIAMNGACFRRRPLSFLSIHVLMTLCPFSLSPSPLHSQSIASRSCHQRPASPSHFDLELVRRISSEPGFLRPSQPSQVAVHPSRHASRGGCPHFSLRQRQRPFLLRRVGPGVDCGSSSLPR